MNNRIYEIFLEHILWNIRFNAFKKKSNNKKLTNVVDAIEENEQRMLMIIYNQYQQVHVQRIMSNPTVKKLLLDNYITHEPF